MLSFVTTATHFINNVRHIFRSSNRFLIAHQQECTNVLNFDCDHNTCTCNILHNYVQKMGSWIYQMPDTGRCLLIKVRLFWEMTTLKYGWKYRAFKEYPQCIILEFYWHTRSLLTYMILIGIFGNSGWNFHCENIFSMPNHHFNVIFLWQGQEEAGISLWIQLIFRCQQTTQTLHITAGLRQRILEVGAVCQAPLLLQSTLQGYLHITVYSKFALAAFDARFHPV